MGPMWRQFSLVMEDVVVLFFSSFLPFKVSLYIIVSYVNLFYFDLQKGQMARGQNESHVALTEVKTRGISF